MVKRQEKKMVSVRQLSQSSTTNPLVWISAPRSDVLYEDSQAPCKSFIAALEIISCVWYLPVVDNAQLYIQSRTCYVSWNPVMSEHE